MIGLRLYTRRPPACLALSAKRRLHRSIDGDARVRGEQGVGRRGAEGMARIGEGFGRGEQEELGVAKARRSVVSTVRTVRKAE